MWMALLWAVPASRPRIFWGSSELPWRSEKKSGPPRGKGGPLGVGDEAGCVDGTERVSEGKNPRPTGDGPWVAKPGNCTATDLRPLGRRPSVPQIRRVSCRASLKQAACQKAK